MTTLERFVQLLLAAPVRLTSVAPQEAYARHVEDALAGAETVAAETGPLIDVGSGTGVPGMVLAIADPERDVTLLEANARKADALGDIARALGLDRVRVVCARAEVHGRGQGRDAFGVAVCRALAAPPVAAELCLPFVRPGGALVMWLGEADLVALGTAAAELGGRIEKEQPHPDGGARRLVVVRKTGPTPGRFPRRDGVAGKRPLAS